MVPRDRIKIDVSDQVVTLTGELEWNFQRQEAERDARRIVGSAAGAQRHHPDAARDREGQLMERLTGEVAHA